MRIYLVWPGPRQTIAALAILVAAIFFKARLQRLDADPHFTYVPGRSHFDVYKLGDDPPRALQPDRRRDVRHRPPGETWKH